ncbi:phosphoribosylanthranilate isomerase [Blattabacterium cuenoti]|uniref:phosphoribosylanthranilate isomerase n=1 Tax=Blattabacterium cuenoti TaxID=1653831 RepID=UPI00163CA91F|nr:phosphoribosylanthranilate isomerase [Blattabacterium cuenoti]
MKLKSLKIKICGMKYDIKKISYFLPDFMGFIFYKKSPRYVGKNFIIPDISNKILKIGVFVNDNKDNILKISKEKKLDFIQLHGKESAFFCEQLCKRKVKIIKSFKIDKYFLFKKIYDYIPFCPYFIFDNNGGSGQKFTWEKLNEYYFETPFFLSGGIGINDVEKIQKFFHPKMIGIDINSKFEIFPGKKNKKILKIFLKKIKNL